MPANREKSPNELAFHDGPSDWDVLFEGDSSNSGVISAFEAPDENATQSDPEADKAKQKEQRENEERMEEVEHQLSRRLAELDDLGEQKKRFFGQVEEVIEEMRRGRADSTEAVVAISRAEHLLEDIDSAIHSASRVCEEYGDTAHDIGDKESEHKAADIDEQLHSERRKLGYDFDQCQQWRRNVAIIDNNLHAFRG